VFASMFHFLNCVNCFLLGIMYSRGNKSKSNKITHASSSSNVGNCVMNLEDDYEKVTNQHSTTKDNISGIPYLIKSIKGKWIGEWLNDPFM